jgi:hypothetical protein
MRLEIVPKDTTIEAARIQFSILRKMGMEGRARMAFELSDALRSITESGVRQRHPDYDENMVRLAAIRIAIGEELFRQAYPDIEIES